MLSRLPATATAAATATGAEATTTAAAATRAEAAAAARTRAAGTILRLVDAQLTATHREAIQRLDGLGGLGLRHLDEAEPARTTGLTVSRQGDVLDRAVLREQVAHLGFGRRERQVSNIDLHDSSLSLFQIQNGRTRHSCESRRQPFTTAGNTVGIV